MIGEQTVRLTEMETRPLAECRVTMGHVTWPVRSARVRTYSLILNKLTKYVGGIRRPGHVLSRGTIWQSGEMQAVRQRHQMSAKHASWLVAEELTAYFSSRTSFSLALLMSSIFLISSSVSFWISSSERFSSSSLIFLSFIAFLMASLPSR